jgi:hypothetical protein
MPSSKKTARTSQSPSTPRSQSSERLVRLILRPETDAPIDKDHPPITSSAVENSRGYYQPSPGPNYLDAQNPTNHPPSTTSITSQLRDVLLPLVMQNAQLRPKYSMDKMHPARIRDNVKEALIDDFCESFVGKMQSVERQMQLSQAAELSKQGKERKARFSAAGENIAIPDGQVSTHPIGNPNRNIGSQFVATSSALPPSTITILPTPPISALLSNAPKAPRAMRVHEFIHGSSQLTHPTLPPRPLSRKGKEKASFDDLNESSKNSVLQSQNHDDNILRSQKSPQNTLKPRMQSPGASGIAIPMNTEFFGPPTRGRARDDSTSTYHPSRRRSSSVTTQRVSPPPPSRFARSSRHRLSRSPDGYRPQTYRSPHYNDHSHRVPHRPRSRSRSPTRSVPYSPPHPTYRGRDRDRTPSEDSYRFPARNDSHHRSSYRSKSRSRTRRYSQSPEHSFRPRDRHPDHVIIDCPPERVRQHHSYRSKSRTRSPSRPLSIPHSPKSSSRHSDYAPTPINRPRRDTSLLPLKNQDRPRSLLLLQSRSRSRSARDSRSTHDNREPERPTSSRFDSLSYLPTSMQVEKAMSIPPQPCVKKTLAKVMEPCRNVPGLWFYKMSHEGVRIMECEIEIDRETSLKWNLFEQSQ